MRVIFTPLLDLADILLDLLTFLAFLLDVFLMVFLIVFFGLDLTFFDVLVLLFGFIFPDLLVIFPPRVDLVVLDILFAIVVTNNNAKNTIQDYTIDRYLAV